jgi:hypothetical protein
MNGFEQIKSFYSWVFNNPEKVRPTHISLYLFLWNQNNRANWVEWFKCPYDLAMQGSCIGNNGTYYKCLDELKRWGLIDYKKGINNYKAPIIRLIQLYDNEQQCEQLTEQVTVPLSEQQTEQQTVQLTEQLPAHIYKLLTNNLKRITNNIESVINFLDDSEKSDFGEMICIYDFETLKKELFKEIWLESIAMASYSKGISMADLKKQLLIFCETIRDTKDFGKPIKNYQNHFVHWFQKQPGKQPEKVKAVVFNMK